jgi:uncharacterized protein YrzB (UPF0473 family)
MNNTEGFRCERTLWFKERLQAVFKNLPITLWDERLSTVAAKKGMGNLSANKKNEVIDTLAACYILQGYLDWKNARINEEEVKSLDNDLYDNDEYEYITMTGDDGNEVNFVILDETEYNGVNYLLVLEESSIDDDNAEASIIKAVADQDEDEIYEFIEDDTEFNTVAGLFQENDDYDIEF